jgi:hypothetical protein
MTTANYKVIKKALLKKKAEVKASPAAAKKFLGDRGLGDILENADVIKVVIAKKSKSKRILPIRPNQYC